jgi:hypothetical protein
MFQHLELRRHEIELFAGLAADPLTLAAAFWAALLVFFQVVFYSLVGQVGR